MEWKKIVKAILRILWMLRLEKCHQAESSKGLRSSKGSKGQKDVSPNETDSDKPPAKHMRNKQGKVALQNPSLHPDATNGSNLSNLSIISVVSAISVCPSILYVSWGNQNRGIQDNGQMVAKVQR